jgi:hypothetical protein
MTAIKEIVQVFGAHYCQLTNYKRQRPYLEVNRSSVSKKIHRIKIIPDHLLPSSQDPATYPYPPIYN